MTQGILCWRGGMADLLGCLVGLHLSFTGGDIYFALCYANPRFCEHCQTLKKGSKGERFQAQERAHVAWGGIDLVYLRRPRHT